LTSKKELSAPIHAANPKISPVSKVFSVLSSFLDCFVESSVGVLIGVGNAQATCSTMNSLGTMVSTLKEVASWPFTLTFSSSIKLELVIRIKNGLLSPFIGRKAAVFLDDDDALADPRLKLLGLSHWYH
jgi:hypothetical protein